MSLAEISRRDVESGQLWFTGPASFTALAARDRRTLLAEIAKLNNDITACQLDRDEARRKLDYRNREAPHCPSCDCGSQLPKTGVS